MDLNFDVFLSVSDEDIKKLEKWLCQVFKASPLKSPAVDSCNIVYSMRAKLKISDVMNIVCDWWLKGFHHHNFAKPPTSSTQATQQHKSSTVGFSFPYLDMVVPYDQFQ